jgi:hypothetical protein
MMRYYKTLVTRVVDKERIIMLCTIKNFLRTITIYVKILPKLDYGIEIIGFLNPLPMPGTYALMVDMHDGMMLGISSNVYENFGIPAKFVYGFAQEGTEFNIDQFCPELIDLHASGEIANPEGNVVSFDTTILAKNYYLAEDDESEGEDDTSHHSNNIGEKEEIDKFNYSMDSKNKYRQAKINVVRFCEIPYKPKLLNILLFTEV